VSPIVIEPKPLHVLMTADTVGGVWTYAVDLARGLASRDVRTTLAVLGPAPNARQVAAAASIPGLTLMELGGVLDWTATDSADVDLQGIRLAMLAAELRPDILHLNSPALGANARFPCPVVAGCHSCVGTWWSAVKGEPPMPKDLAWRAALKTRGYAAADLLLAPSQAFATATQAEHGLAVLPRVVLNGRPQPIEAPRPVSAPSGPFAFTAGRLWDEGKGMSVLDKAAAQLSLPIFAAGTLCGPNDAKVRLRHVKPLGHLSETEMAGWFASQPIFVSTAFYEPFGLAVLEAAMAACPMVLSDIPTFRELWDGCAFFVTPGDAQGFADAVEGLAKDAARRSELGDAARRRAAAYSLDGMIDGTLAVYRELVAAADLRRSMM